MGKQLLFEIVPHMGIGPARLGATPADVESAFANLQGALPRHTKGREERCHLYFDNALQIEFGRSGLAQHVGISNHKSIITMYCGQDVFDIAAPDLFILIASREQAGLHSYTSADYLFPNQLVTLWEAAEQYDRKGASSRPVFAQVGVGNSEYWDAIEAIRAKAEARRLANPRQAEQPMLETRSRRDE